MSGRLDFDRDWQLAPPDPGQEFLARLDRALGPPMLLRFEAVHVHRQFRRRNDIGKKNELPPNELGPITKIEVLGQRIMLPPACFHDARFPPQPGRTVKIEKPSAAAPGSLFEQQVTVEEHRLHASEK